MSRGRAFRRGDFMSLILAENIQKDYKTGEVTVKALKGGEFYAMF